MTARRVVITGIGLVTPLGTGPAAVWASLLAGTSAVRPIRSFDAAPLPVHFGAEIDGFDPKLYVEKNQRKRLNAMARTSHLAVAGAKLALDDARVDRAALDPDRCGVSFGTGTIPGDPGDLAAGAWASRDPDAPGRVSYALWGAGGMRLVPPMWMLNHVPNMPAGHVSILNDFRGPNNTNTQGDAAGLLALVEACRAVARGRADLFLAGGADTKTNPVTMVRQCLFAPLSRRNDDPVRACRPFDRGRDGTALGEGAGVVVVERLDHARRRGAAVLAEVTGWGAAFDADLSGRGVTRAVAAALAGTDPSAVDHVNAQGYGTRADDAREARGLSGLGVPVFALKGATGNLGTAAGVVELAASLLALRHGTLPRTVNHDDPDPDCPVAVTREPRPVARPAFVKVSLTRSGQCAAVACRVFEPDD